MAPTGREGAVTVQRAARVGPGLLALVAALAGCRRSDVSPPAPPPVRVAAAADLTLAFEALAQAFTRATGERVVLGFGSSGLLARQLRAGAPFDVFAAANVTFVDDLVAAGVCDGTTRAPYARGRLAVWTRRGGVAPPTHLAELAAPRFRRIAIANPAHAPYGLAARQALEHAAVWEAVQPRLVLGENVRQTLQFAESGNVEAAVVAVSLVVHDGHNPWHVIAETMHRPLDQALAVCTRGSNRAGGAAFARFVRTEAGRAIMRRFGFLLPGESPAPTP